MAGSLDRRQFLGRSVATGRGHRRVGGGASTLLAACGSSSKGTTAGTTGGTAPRATSARRSSSSRGSRTSSSPVSTSPSPTTTSRRPGSRAWSCSPAAPASTRTRWSPPARPSSCISSPDITSAKILQGAGLISIAAQYQKNPFCITSLASNPLPNPQAMIGKKVGVQSTNLSAWKSFLKANNIQESQLTTANVRLRPHPARRRTGRRLVLVHHQRAHPDQRRRSPRRDLPAQRLQLPARVADHRRPDARRCENKRDDAQGAPQGRHHGLARRR